jgi:hypothetical protein
MWYVSEKERNLSMEMKKALNHFYLLQKKQSHDTTSCLYFSEKKYLVDKQDLYINYKKRQGFISGAKRNYIKYKNLITNQQVKSDSIDYQPKLCECGCNQILDNSKNRFINGHNVNLRSQIYKEELAKKMRQIKFDTYEDYQI